MEDIPYGLNEFPKEALEETKPLIGFYRGNQVEDQLIQPLRDRFSPSCRIVDIDVESLPIHTEKEKDYTQYNHFMKYTWFDKHLNKIPGIVCMHYSIDITASQEDWDKFVAQVSEDYKKINDRVKYYKVPIYIVLYNKNKNDYSDEIKVSNSVRSDKYHPPLPLLISLDCASCWESVTTP